MKTPRLLTLLATAGLLFTTTALAEPPSSLKDIVLKAAPKESVSIHTLRSDAKPGDEVAFHGDVIGRHPVFIKDLAVMVMGDPEVLTSCDRRPGDSCKTPWDVCCDDRTAVKNNIVTIQVLDAAGAPIREGFKDLDGLAALGSAVVTGVVAESSTKDAMVINATGIYVKK